MNESEPIGSRIVRARAALGMSQAELATQLGVAATQVARWEKGKANPRPETLHKVAGVLKVTPDWIERGEGEMNSDNPLLEDAEIEAELNERQLRVLRNRAKASGRSLGAELQAMTNEFEREWRDTPPPLAGYLKLAITDKLQKLLSKAAEENGRTLNEEIVERLSDSMDVDVPRLHKTIANLSDALTEESARRKRELRVVFTAFEQAVEELRELVEAAELEDSDERYNELNSTYVEQLSKLHEIESYIDADNPHLKEL